MLPRVEMQTVLEELLLAQEVVVQVVKQVAVSQLAERVREKGAREEEVEMALEETLQESEEAAQLVMLVLVPLSAEWAMGREEIQPITVPRELELEPVEMLLESEEAALLEMLELDQELEEEGLVLVEAGVLLEGKELAKEEMLQVLVEAAV